jgi:hypothetical protein
MSPPTRRRLLGSLVAALSAAGFAERAGHDPVLRIRNYAQESIEVQITVYRRYVGEDRDEELFYEEAVSVDASTTRELEVFTAEDQYRVVVERADRSVGFPTRPTCEDASTTVTLRPSGHVEYHVEFCEGNDRSGSSRPS